ncbi:hypothetical protein KFK09_012261 [Dendrobium nobile]|uniref:Rhodanese domain-containing protein n=1 Tax=Dendrobium nobile TaxID=94219 RepID=A0A8T3BIE2_DENNO|nr:hypothetical protein KFK09_012261 [Dendrobium nobile]
MEENGDGRDTESYGVLLYYNYISIPDATSLARFYDTHCRSLNLFGRIRVGHEGVNATIGGKLSALEEHITVMNSNSLFDGTDFKLAPCGHPSNEKIARECGFTSLSVRVVKELVTFMSDPLLKSPVISNAGRHLSASEFHYVLHQAAECANDGNALQCEARMQNEDLVLLDARNVYETRIGKFKILNINTLDPEIRQYSDLASWIDKHSERLRNKNVLMYCTGGIRCEMASAYIRSKGAGFGNVFQLFGGIQRYMEQFPDGGFFKGKNFVFDHRISVGSQDKDVLGTCLICSSPFDDYSSRCRCFYCRMLVLVCYNCQGNYRGRYICELCQKHDNVEKPVPLVQNSHQELSQESFDVTETEAETSHDSSEKPCREHSTRSVSDRSRKLRILCLHGFRQNASSFKGRTSSLAKKLKNNVEFIFIDAPHELPFIFQPTEQQISPVLSENCKKRFAWLISPNSTSSDENSWRIAEQQFDPFQYKMQTEGFELSYSYLQHVVLKNGPFDGILGFSQGAAMAALFLEQQQRSGQVSGLRFAVLCSGFSTVSCKSVGGFIKYPSLHIFGDGRGRDRQINCEVSRDLADLFDKNSSVTIEHDMGHIIPTRSPYIDQIKAFLLSFL